MAPRRQHGLRAAIALLFAATLSTPTSAGPAFLPPREQPKNAFEVSVEHGGAAHTLSVAADQEPADAVLRFCRALPAPCAPAVRRQLAARVCASAAKGRCGRTAAEVVAVPLTSEDGTALGVLSLLDGEEAYDAARAFARARDLPAFFAASVGAHLCGLAETNAEVLCTRRKAAVWHAASILGPDGVTPLGAPLTVLEDEKPPEAVLAYCNALDPPCPAEFRRTMTRHVCGAEGVECAGGDARAVVFSIALANEHGGTLGTLQVLDGEAVADATCRFGRAQTPPLGWWWSREVAKRVCASAPQQGLECGAAEGVQWQGNVAGPDGTLAGELVVPDSEEAADAVYSFVAKNDLPAWYADSLTGTLCGPEADSDEYKAARDPAVLPPSDPRGRRLLCQRRRSLLHRVPIADEKSNGVGDLLLVRGEEVADTAYKFAYARRLSAFFRKQLTEKLCTFEGVLCTRHRAVAYYAVPPVAADPPRPSDSGPLPPLLVWDDEEPADSIEVYRRVNNMTHGFGQALLAQLCTGPDGSVDDGGGDGDVKDKPPPKPLLKCERAEAVVHRFQASDQSGGDHGVVEVYAGQYPVDAVYAWAHDQEMHQPRFNGSFARVFERLCATAPPHVADKCAEATYPREEWFELELTYAGLPRKFPIYRPDALDGRPSCVPLALRRNSLCFTEAWQDADMCKDGADGRPLPAAAAAAAAAANASAADDGTADGRVAFAYALTRYDTAAQRLLAFEEDGACVPDDLAAARRVCGLLHPSPRNCEADLYVAVAQHVERVEKSRWDTPPGSGGQVDLYRALTTVRTSPPHMIHAQYLRHSAELVGPLRSVTRQLAAMNATYVAAAVAEASALQTVAALGATVRMAHRALNASAAMLTLARSARRTATDMFASGNATLAAVATALNNTLPVNRSSATAGVADGFGAPGADELRRVSRLPASAAADAVTAALAASADVAALADAAADRALSTAAAADAALHAAQRLRYHADVEMDRAKGLFEDVDAARVRLKPRLDQIQMRHRVLKQANETLTDFTKRTFFDKPCQPIFGACCARDQPDGGKQIMCG